MALTKSERDLAKKADRIARAEARRAATTEVMEARMRTGIGFGATYVATQILPNFAPSVLEYKTTIDLALAGIGGYLALTDDGPMGDYAVGIALVGATQTLDKISLTIDEWLNAA